MKNRIYGIDVLKVLSMFFILVLHINSNGGLLNNVPVGSKKFAIVLILEIICLCAVNIYGIISGYLSYSKYDSNTSKVYNFKRLIYLWIQVVFYSFITTIILVALGKIEVSRKDMLLIFLPVANKYLWYFTAYFLLFFFTPVINSFVKNSSNRVVIAVLIPIIVLFVFYQSFVKDYIGNFTFTNEGYSVWWLLILFYIGAVIKKTNLGKNISSKKLLLCLVAVYIISFSWKFFIPILANKVEFLKYYGNFLFEYISPSNVFAAIIYVLLLIRIKVNSNLAKNILPTLSAATFGVYVMHLHPYVWTNIIRNSFVFILDYNIYFEPLIVIIIALIGLIIMLVIDIVRTKIFKLFRVDKLCEKIDSLFNNIQNSFINKISN